MCDFSADGHSGPLWMTYDLISDGTATVADVELYVGDSLVFHGAGSSRRVKGDKYDAQLGYTLALQRALGNAVASMAAFTGKKIAALDKASQATTELAAAKSAHPAGKGKKNRSDLSDLTFADLLTW
jgi:hypothetical protein